LSYRGEIFRGDSSHREPGFCQTKSERQDFSAANRTGAVEISQFETAAASAKVSGMRGKILLPAIFVATFALSRMPGLLPPNFSAAYAFAFCAGLFFSGALAWWLPLGTMLLTDVGLNLYYSAHGVRVWDLPDVENQLFNYAAFGVLIFLGGRFRGQRSFFKRVGGGLLGAVLFYLITNTASWLFNPFHNPEYAKNLAGWLLALTKGTGGYPTTLEFFRNTLTSGGLFTALFVASEKLAAESPAEKTAGAGETDDEPAAETEEAKA